MTQVTSLYTRLRAPQATRDQGASAVEYGLLIAAIAAIIVAVVFAIGVTTKGNYSTAKTCLDDPTAAACQ